MNHGGDLITYTSQVGIDLMDFSSNINPLGYPDGLEGKILNRLSDLKRYPDIKYRILRERIARYLGCTIENVVVGNGAVEIIDSFILNSDRVIIAVPSFSEYEVRAKVHKKEVVKFELNEDFTINLSKLPPLRTGDLLILGNPNNPTGLRIPIEMLMKIYSNINEEGAFMLLDEAFFEFCPDKYNSIVIFSPHEYNNVGIIRAATKFFGLPGIRLGYCCTSHNKAEKLSSILMPWSVNSVAEAAGEVIFSDLQYIEASKRYISCERDFLMDGLLQLKSLEPVKSDANFILIKLLGLLERDIFQHLLQQGILVRKCSSFEGLRGEYIRIAVRTREENQRLLDTLKKSVMTS